MLLTPLHQWWRKLCSLALQLHFGAAAVAAPKDAMIEAWGPMEPCAQLGFRGTEPSSCRVQPDTFLAYRRFLPRISNSSHFTSQQTLRMRGLSSHVSHSSDLAGITGTNICFIKYFIVTCKWGMQVRWPGSQDFISLHGNGSRFPSGSLHLCLDFDYKHL